jgi:hypothetical protein
MAHPAFAAMLPSEAEAGFPKETSRVLASRLKKGAAMKLRIVDHDAGQATVKLPAPALGRARSATSPAPPASSWTSSPKTSKSS